MAKASPYYNAGVFNLVLGAQAGNPAPAIRIHNASANHDAMTFGPYLASEVNNFANNEELFGSLFAESEMHNTAGGFMYRNYTNLLNSSRPVPASIYEVNLHTTFGSISQDVLNAFAPSLGAGLAVVDHMLMIMRNLQMTEQCLYSATGYRNTRTDGKTVLLWGSVRDCGVTDRKRPQYLACQLANRALAGDMVATTNTGDNPTWSVTNLNRVTYTNAHFLRSYAFRNGGSRSLIVFNLHRTDPLTADFAGPLAPTGRVTVQQLTSTNITANNESSNVVAITTQVMANFNPVQAFVLPACSMTLLQWTTAPPHIVAIDVDHLGGAVRIDWDADVGRLYLVRFSPTLTNWADAGLPRTASNTLMTYTDDGSETGGYPPLLATQRFYHVILLP